MKPKYLQDGAKIYFIAPSFGCTISPYKERLEKAIKTFKKLKFEITIGDNCYLDCGVASSNTPQLRAKEFMDAYKSDCDAIFSVGGGEMMCEILEYINFNELKNYKPKWFIGFSDNTNLTYTLTTLCDLETVYGNNVPNFYKYPLEYDTLDTYNILKGQLEFKGYDGFMLRGSKAKFPKYKFDNKKIITPYNYTKEFSGILLGGCLDCLINLCGTKFDNTINYINNHKNEGIIFYLEACDLTSVGIRRALWSLKNAGWFNNIRGFLIGRSLQFNDESFGFTPINAYIDMLKEYNAPILLNVDLGHISPSLPIRNGAYATIKYENENINIKYRS